MTDAERPETDPPESPGTPEPSPPGAPEAPAAGPMGRFSPQEIEYYKLLQAAKRGGGWFYWIAGLSMVNTISITMNLGFSMLVGLAATQIVDSIGQEIAEAAESSTVSGVVTAITFGLSACIAGGFVFLGWATQRLWTWPYYLGITLYAIDGAVFLAFGDKLSFGFHVFVLFMLYGGLRATRAVRRAGGGAPSGPPPDPLAAAVDGPADPPGP